MGHTLARLGWMLALVLGLAAPGAARAEGSEAEFTRHFEQGLAALRAGQYSEAVAAFQSAERARPGRVAPAYNLACAHALGGRRPTRR
ncbi:MAG: hypothetical protein KatS3mg102_1873 [Planctomycetota bacterium]|nr:MAG: hypothetical protein KatS3mg102_1873 [Planctomycetota bacterium]